MTEENPDNPFFYIVLLFLVFGFALYFLKDKLKSKGFGFIFGNSEWAFVNLVMRWVKI